MRGAALETAPRWLARFATVCGAAPACACCIVRCVVSHHVRAGDAARVRGAGPETAPTRAIACACRRRTASTPLFCAVEFRRAGAGRARALCEQAGKHAAGELGRRCVFACLCVCVCARARCVTRSRRAACLPVPIGSDLPSTPLPDASPPCLSASSSSPPAPARTIKRDGRERQISENQPLHLVSVSFHCPPACAARVH